MLQILNDPNEIVSIDEMNEVKRSLIEMIANDEDRAVLTHS